MKVPVRLWRPAQLEAVATALEKARSGMPAVLSVSGVAGSGKSALLDEIVAQAADFVVLSAEGSEDDRMPYAVLERWGAQVPAASVGTAEPFVVAQRLRDLVDANGRRALLLRLDDLQWADPESVDALLWLLRRSVDDHLLVVVGTRPLDPEVHPAWLRWVASGNHAVSIALDGLTVDQVVELMAAKDYHPPRSVAVALTEHTSGNPLYLHSLLNEFEPADLARRQVLPAPAVFARTIAGQVSRLAEPAARLLQGAAVLGNAWNSLLDIASIAGLPDPSAAAQELEDAGLIQLRLSVAGYACRVAHALIRAAVYQQIPLLVRKDLHRKASAVLLDEGAVLDHRLAASATYDEDLADALDRYAQRLRRRHAWRLSADYLRGAASVTDDPARRRARGLEALLDTVLIPDVATAKAELADARGTDDPAELVVRGLILLSDGHDAQGRALLATLLARPRDSMDPTVRYRAAVLLAWAVIRVGAPPEDVDRVLRQGEELSVQDVCVQYQYRFARTIVDQNMLPPAVQWAALNPNLGNPSTVASSDDLVQRAVVAVRVGLFEVARADLLELLGRIREGVLQTFGVRVAGGLGYVHWLLGDWPAARLALNLAQEMTGDTFYRPYLMITDGRFDEADAAIAELQREADRIGSVVSVSNLAHLLVVRGLASGDEAVMKSIGDRLIHGIVDAFDRNRIITVSWLRSAGVAAYWAGRPDVVRRCAAELGAAVPAPAWAPACRWWHLALADIASGDRVSALAKLERATQDAALNLPLYRAQILLDHAEVADRLGKSAVKQVSLTAAEKIYRELGAIPYLRRLGDLAPAAKAPPAVAAVELSARERDVLTLVVNGMSYAQIAAELFITQKTVGYHLSNMYAKAGVGGRHQLAALARRRPEQFQLVG